MGGGTSREIVLRGGQAGKLAAAQERVCGCETLLQIAVTTLVRQLLAHGGDSRCSRVLVELDRGLTELRTAVCRWTLLMKNGSLRSAPWGECGRAMRGENYLAVDNCVVHPRSACDEKVRCAAWRERETTDRSRLFVRGGCASAQHVGGCCEKRIDK